MKNELFKNLIVRKIFREMSDVSVIFQFFLVLLSAAIDLLNNSFFFVPNFCSNKMTLCESLFNKDSREPFMIFCLESIYKNANIPIDPTTHAILSQILFAFFQDLVCNKRFFEETAELNTSFQVFVLKKGTKNALAISMQKMAWILLAISATLFGCILLI